MKKAIVISRFGEIENKDDDHIIWMTKNEFTKIVVGKEASNSEYVISEGVIEPEGFVPNHYHKWEDQTFHVIEGELEAKIGDKTVQIGSGGSIHCPKGIPHFMKNIGKNNAKLISYIFPGEWAEAFFYETGRQIKSGELDFKLIEDKFGVVYL